MSDVTKGSSKGPAATSAVDESALSQAPSQAPSQGSALSRKSVTFEAHEQANGQDDEHEVVEDEEEEAAGAGAVTGEAIRPRRLDPSLAGTALDPEMAVCSRTNCLGCRYHG